MNRTVGCAAVALVSGAALLASCSAPGLTDSGSRFEVAGEWSWISSMGGIAGETRTPDSTGDNQRLALDRDGTLRLFRNGTLRVETTWHAPSNPAIGAPSAMTFGEPSPFGFGFAELAMTHPDTLILTDPCCDGFTRTWARIP